MDKSLNYGAEGRGFGSTFGPSLKLVMKEDQQQQLEERSRSSRGEGTIGGGGAAVGGGGKAAGEGGGAEVANIVS